MQKPLPKNTMHSSFPKLKRKTITAAGFSSTRTVPNNTLKSFNSDYIFFREIEKKIEEQRKDLDERNVAIKSLLVHFEHIASMCRTEKNKNVEFRQQNMELMKELKTLKNLSEEKLEKNKNFKDQKSLGFVNTEEHENVRKDNNQLKETVKKLEKDLIEKSKDISNLNSQLSSLKLNISAQDKVVSDVKLELSLSKGYKKKLEEDLSNYKLQSETLKENTIKYMDQIDRLNEEIDKHVKENKILVEDIENKDKEIDKMKAWTAKLNTQNEEMIETKSNNNLILSQVSIGPNDNLLNVIEKFTKALNSSYEKIALIEKENSYLKDKVNKGSAARKELLNSIEEFRRNNQNDVLKYEKMLQSYESNKKIKDQELKDLSESLQRSEAQKKTYMEDLQAIEIELYNQRQSLSNSMKKNEECFSEIQKLELKITSKNDEISNYEKKMTKYHSLKIKHQISEKEIKAIREENIHLDKLNETLSTKYQADKSAWAKEENSLLQQIQALQEELNNEKKFNSVHLQEVMKLKRALSSTDFKVNKDQYAEEESRLKARIANLEMDGAENKEIIFKLNKDISYSALQINEKSKLVVELESKIQQLVQELNNPDFVDVAGKALILKEREKAVESELQKVFFALKAFENGMTCIVCISQFDAPVIVVPCGHVLCAKCLDSIKAVCPQCSLKIQGSYRIQWLDHLVDKIAFQRQVLDSIKSLIRTSAFGEAPKSRVEAEDA